ncbi:hypothetical protein [Flammeovirga aprica]|uniref:Uncharacterized protein n=1 Tax=Flammeovirga aprica JL-4 TaxID=694437 RepID=A0A7X9P136_9BACT|nr:hypothetical protein [Flammeovirga aprica]NME67616.1 hypothetical protein [Flammeovirga aprica JL-4]
MSSVNVYIPLDLNGIVKKPKYYGGFTFAQIMTYAGALALGFDAVSYLREILFTEVTFSSFLKDFWFDDLIFFGEVSFLLAIKPYLSNSPTAWYKSFIYFDGDELIVNRTGFNRRSVNLNDVVSFEDRDKSSSRSFLTFTHKNGEKTSIPWLLGHEIEQDDENTVKGLLTLIQRKIDNNTSQFSENKTLINASILTFQSFE